MEELTSNVTAATKLEPTVATAAIGHVLLFLRDKDASGHVAEMIEKMPRAHEAVAAAASTGDGGVTQVIEAMTSFMGHGRVDLNILAGKLENLGVSEAQTYALLKEVLARAETLIGPEATGKIRAILPELAERSSPRSELRRSA